MTVAMTPTLANNSAPLLCLRTRNRGGRMRDDRAARFAQNDRAVAVDAVGCPVTGDDIETRSLQLLESVAKRHAYLLMKHVESLDF
jgi:hypothetical protein